MIQIKESDLTCLKDGNYAVYMFAMAKLFNCDYQEAQYKLDGNKCKLFVPEELYYSASILPRDKTDKCAADLSEYINTEHRGNTVVMFPKRKGMTLEGFRIACDTYVRVSLLYFPKECAENKYMFDGLLPD